MSFRELLESGANVSVTVKLDDLRAILKKAAGTLRSVPQEPSAKEFLTRKEVLAALKIDSSTLWCWEKTGYIKSYPFGGRKRYRRKMSRRSAQAGKEAAVDAKKARQDIPYLRVGTTILKRVRMPLSNGRSIETLIAWNRRQTEGN